MSKVPENMRAMVLKAQKEPLQEMDLPVPRAGPDQVLIKVHACGVCRTDLHIVDGELPSPKLPLILGHEIVGTVVGMGKHVQSFHEGDRIGVPWLGYTDGQCSYCKRGSENLCENALFTGYTIDGGFAEYTVADHRYCFEIPEIYRSSEAAPLLCAGLIGYRSYRMAACDPSVKRIGIYGFGAAAHIICQVALYQEKEIYAFTRPGDLEGQIFAKSLGAKWAGGSDEMPPKKLHSAIIFAPIGSLIPAALRATLKGGTLVCAGIYMSDIPSFPYSLLWEERSVRSVANLTRLDGEEFMRIAPKVPVRTQVQKFQLVDANLALESLRMGRVNGALVLVMGDGS